MRVPWLWGNPHLVCQSVFRAHDPSRRISRYTFEIRDEAMDAAANVRELLEDISTVDGGKSFAVAGRWRKWGKR